MVEQKVMVSDKEIQEVEKQVKQSQDKERSEIEDRVRKEVAAESRLRELENQLSAQQKALDEAKAEAIRAKSEADMLLKKQIEDRQSVGSKAPVSSANPFNGGSVDVKKTLQESLKSDPGFLSKVEASSYNALVGRGRTM